ncbi:MAG: Flp pilus assembly complex ATPase component TadA [Candidatus Pacebacteria bacterium]|jgi:type IV pilus assembly protein PilB|nr:Flp pilus assembly complex ATPase component TadA [Candidatus Paceibacterota bacterium]
MDFNDDSIKQILLDGNYISAEDVEKVEALAKKRRVDFVSVLLSEGYVTKDIIAQSIAESIGVPYFDLTNNAPSREQVLVIPEDIAKKFRIVLVSYDDTTVGIATDNPREEKLEETLAELFPDREVHVYFSVSEDIDTCFEKYQKTLDSRLEAIITAGTKVAPEILRAIFTDALTFNASDIHLEPRADSFLIRFRVDSVLREMGSLPREQYENVLNLIKIQSGIRLDQHFAAQDGSIQFRLDDVVIDLRASIVPTVNGEKIVLRVLNAYVEELLLKELGLSSYHQELLETAARKPFGMVVVVGPTGSGKTTTLYALLKILNNPGINITTIEDPVEYKMRGVNQIQVNSETNLTFAKGLRSIARQDPDIILVGEIRDEETAEIAVNAALTGHLLFSTFHANDSATAIPRLLDMNIEPFLLSSTLELVIAQRLVRKICLKCKHSVVMTSASLKKIYSGVEKFFPKEVTLYEGKGCDACGGSGYKGRLAIFEIIPITAELKALILKNPSSQEIWKVARGQGVESLFEDGIEKVKNGTTSIRELLRVSEPPLTGK